MSSSSGSGGDHSNWSSVSEESLLLHEDLLQLVDHIPLPDQLETSQTGFTGLPTLDGKSPAELSLIIQRECGCQTVTFISLLNYRHNALRKIWNYLRSKEKSSSGGGANAVSVKPAAKGGGEGFASRISLVLVFPILHSLSRIDSELSGETTRILLQSLTSCDPASLSKEPLDCILGLENLLSSWLSAARQKGQEGTGQVTTAASALVALAVAVGTGGLLLRTVHTLQSLVSTHSRISLSLSVVLRKLFKEHDNFEEPPVVLAESHTHTSWEYQYQDETNDNGEDEAHPRSIVYDGRFVVVSSVGGGRRLIKIGSGYSGSIRGYIYQRVSMDPGWLVQCNGVLFYRKKSFDETSSTHLCIRLDGDLQELGGVVDHSLSLEEGYRTVGFMSDGIKLYWMYSLKNEPSNATGTTGDKYNVYLQILDINIDVNDGIEVLPSCERILLKKSKDEKNRMRLSGSSYFSGSTGGGRAKDDNETSCGLSMKQLVKSSGYCTGSSLVLVLPSSPSTSGGSRSLFGSSSSNNNKALCTSYGYSMSSGYLVSQFDLTQSPSLSCGLTKGTGTASIGASYDRYNHCVWSVAGDWIDLWACTGQVRPSAHSLAIRMGLPPNHLQLLEDIENNDIIIEDVIRLLLRHSGMESCRLTKGKDIGEPITHNLSLSFLKHAVTILQYSVDRDQLDNALSCVITLQAVLPNFLKSDIYESKENDKLFDTIRSCCWDLLQKENCSSVLVNEICQLISSNILRLYLQDESQSQLLLSALASSSSSSPMIILRDSVFIELSKELRPLSSLPPSVLSVTGLLATLLHEELNQGMEQLKGGGAKVAMTTQPVFPPVVQCASSILYSILRSMNKATAPTDSTGDTDGHEEEELLEDCRSLLMEFIDGIQLFEICGRFLDGLHCLISTNSTESSTDEGPSIERPLLVPAIEKVSKGSILGAFLPPLLAVISDHTHSSLPLATRLLPCVTELGRKTAECCSMLYSDMKGPVTIPTPWSSGRLIETVHPVRDNYKFKETISFPGAKHLYLKFDPRSSSQYDYDKVQVFAGSSPSCPRVVEYGGNTHGFGSRSVLGKGWPKDIVKVDGDTVTITFEMKSGREHSTPDKAMWGFSCIVRPQETAEESSGGLPFLIDIHLSLSSISCSLIGQLFVGAPPTSDETKCGSLMESLLLQRCVWPDTEVVGGGVRHTPTDPSLITKLRESINKPRPVLRPRISDILQVELMEDLILNTCLKHNEKSIFKFISSKISETDKLLLDDIFTRINGLERRLQALAELESHWFSDVDDIINNDKDIKTAFFFDLQQQESTVKQFELLCCLYSVDTVDPFGAATQLQELMEKDVLRRKDKKDVETDVHSKTISLVQGILDRSRLLLQVNISQEEVHSSVGVSRSVSVPASHLVTSPTVISRQSSDGSSLLLFDNLSSNNNNNHNEEIFKFIGHKPEEAVSCDSFLLAASHQRKRAHDRISSLSSLHSLLTGPQLQSTITHLLSMIGDIIKNGPLVQDITCSGLCNEVRSRFSDVILLIVQETLSNPAAFINTISTLSIIPYTREDEGLLVRTGLLKVLNELCNMDTPPVGVADSEGDEEVLQRVTALAWAAFKVLADRCISWEESGNGRGLGFISSGLAQQISSLLTNHFSRAMETLKNSESGTSETLQEALSMLLGLARSHMGRAILSQPACVSKLLLLVTDQRPSPKLVLIALQLCRIALPLMTVAECSQVIIPSHPALNTTSHAPNGHASIIIKLLMVKLGEYLIPTHSSGGALQTDPTHQERERGDNDPIPIMAPSQQDEIDEAGQASVFLYRRSDETAAEVLQLLLNQDPRQLAHRMETILRLDQALTDNNKAEILTDNYKSCFRKAVRWASMGFTVSIEPTTNGTSHEPSGTEGDRKRSKAETTCKKKNMELLKSDPPRPFLSGTVSYSLASEIIGLLNGLLVGEDAVQVWRNAIEDVLSEALQSVPVNLPLLEEYCSIVHECVNKCETPPSPQPHLSFASIANACFAALGGFKDPLRVGSVVKVLGEGVLDSTGSVASISEQRGVANVILNDKHCFGVNNTLEVPLTRLVPPEVGTLPIKQLAVSTDLCLAINSVLSTSPMTIESPHSGMNAGTQGLGLVRLYCELRARACLCLAAQCRDSDEFKKLFINNNNKDNLSQLRRHVETIKPGQRLSVVESQCLSLRMLYRDCSRPPPPKIERPRIERKRFFLDITRQWPPVSHSSFSHSLTWLVYQGPTTSGGGVTGSDTDRQDKPKGVFIVTNNPIPHHAPSFYYEVEVVQLDSGTVSPHLSFGVCPSPEKPSDNEGAWSYPQETCLFRNSGRGFQVRGVDRMQWPKISSETLIKNGDIVGCGWIKEDTPTARGVVYFTVNGNRLEQSFKECPSGLYPFVHVQKKGTRLKLNFGEYSFSYAEGQAHRDAADIDKGESLEEIVALFKLLPFHPIDEEEDPEGLTPDNVDNAIPNDETDSVKHTPLILVPNTVVLEPVTNEVYDSKSSQGFIPRLSFDNILEGGPLIRPGGVTNQEEEELEEGGAVEGVAGDEDLHSLLVKAWEAKVFPLIQRRFRNDQERKSGLDQIRGALQLGMESIAQETVEFLYEENGGLPRDLHLPSMDDVKADLEKFTISRIKKGSAVVIQKEVPYSRCGVRAMQKTQGLTGVVLSVDSANELVQVECYVPSDGALVRFWYPVIYLEKPPKGYRKPSALRGADTINILVHRELVTSEGALAGLYCRSALLSLQSVSQFLPFPLYITLYSQESYSQPTVEGLSASSSPSLSPSLSHSLLSSLQPQFYSDPALMERELLSWLRDHSVDVQSLLVRLSEGVSVSSGGNGRREFLIPEGREITDVQCPGAAFLIVSSSHVKPGNKINSNYKYPWCKVFTYRSGQGRGGRLLPLEVSRYPNEMPQQTVNQQYSGPLHPTLVIPSDRLHMKLTGSTPHPGRKILVHSISTAIPLLLSLSHSLSLHFDCSSKNDYRYLSSCVQPLVKLLAKSDWPLMMRGRINHTLSNVLWTLSDSGKEQTQLPLLPSDLLPSLLQEVEQWYTEECDSFTNSSNTGNGGTGSSDDGKSKGTPFAPFGSIASGRFGRFSCYLQSVLELVLAIKEYNGGQTTPTNGASKSANKKLKKFHWMDYVSRAVDVLFALRGKQKLNPDFYKCFYKSLPSKCHTSILVLTGINSALQGEVAMETIRRLCSGYGGLVDLYLPLRDMSREEREEEQRIKLEELAKESTSQQATPQATPTSLDEAVSDTAERPEPAEKKNSLQGERPKLLAPPTSLEPPKQVPMGGAVLRIGCGHKSSALCTSLLSCPALQGNKKKLSVYCVSEGFQCGEEESANEILKKYLRNKLYSGVSSFAGGLSSSLSDIFNSLGPQVLQTSLTGTGATESLLRLFIVGCGHTLKGGVAQLWGSKSKDSSISEKDLMEWTARQEPVNIWRGLTAAGYDLDFNRCGFLPSEGVSSCPPDSALDSALALHVDSKCRSLDIVSSLLLPSELHVTDAELTAAHLVPLQKLSINEIRMRFIVLKNINRQLSWLLPLVNLNSTHPSSLGCGLTRVAAVMFYDVKNTFLHRVLNAATRRTLDQAPPEIKMDPLESVGGLPSTLLKTHFCQAANQMLSVPSSQLCVPLASGGDPTYAFNVKLSGEEVHGTSGSFRHFLWQVVRELESPLVPVLIQCPSSASGINKGKFILTTGSMSYSEEKLLFFFGQLLGVSLRADVPVALDLLVCFWKSLKGEPLSLVDLKEADSVTYSLTQEIIEAKDETSFNEIISSLCQDTDTHTAGTDAHTAGTDTHTASLTFTYRNLRGDQEPLEKDGDHRLVTFGDRGEYVDKVRSFRLREIESVDRMRAVRCGLASVVPVEALSVFTAADLDLRICGIPHVDINYLKMHTTYHVGLMESDKHIQYFWTALESLSQEELRKFIKFACNQERIPFGDPCRGGGEVINVPPYPMKIAPPDGQGIPDSRYIRAETCMFLIKLPQYSNQEIMTERLVYAINCREDPLSG